MFYLRDIKYFISFSAPAKKPAAKKESSSEEDSSDEEEEKPKAKAKAGKLNNLLSILSNKRKTK